MTPPLLTPSVDHAAVPVADSGHRDGRAEQGATSWWRRLFGFIGPGYLVAVGYMDPGNWATDLAGGAAYGYSLLWVIGLSSGMAMLLQILAARLGIVAGADLAQLCRRHAGPRSCMAQWLLCELAICACDLAEVIGTAVALKLLFGMPLSAGVLLTVLDVLLILWLQQRGMRYLEAFVVSLMGIVFLCFGINLILAQPDWHAVAAGLVPTARTVTDPGMLYLAIGIVGATVMPHNLYLHSSIVQARSPGAGDAGRRSAIGFATIDVVVALALALLVNGAILVTAAAVFHTSGHQDMANLEDAYRLMGPLTGSALAGVLFALALLAAGQSSSITATLAGQVVMEGFVRLRVPAWQRRLATRALAVVPAFLVTLLCGDEGIGRLLLLSQVVLSLQLPFAMFPLIRFTADPQIMGRFANPRWVTLLAWAAMATIVILNAVLIGKALA